ncbi:MULTISPECIES: lipoyl protein ligase domain-containing protein [Prochlorococcus]|uniref:lipoyl protein ligase domain-containing protein n=1 Tax=Prochlorococcus TaxID=1218 RepID=UPI000533B162|nr:MULTISPECIES: lipoate--protein ligase [Prochlorococcus]KGG12852.1 Lipoate-protein ligase A [Prochlorococcus sp. MIT 0601]
MATDMLMLEKVASNNELTLLIRFYKWSGGPWLSIGRNQKELPKKWLNLYHKKVIDIVRRPSGGNAVLHTNGLTYALAWCSPPRKKHQAYFEASKWITNCFSQLDVNLKFGTIASKNVNENCFASSTNADLIDEKNSKRVGSAQAWRKGNLLQHGEILLQPDEEIWAELFNSKPPEPINAEITSFELEDLLVESFIAQWPDIDLHKTNFSLQDIAKAKENSKSYFFELSKLDT